MDVVIVDAVRTPFGKSGGVLKGWHPVELMAAVLTGIAQRSNFEPADIQRVTCGCATPVGEHALNIARSAVLAADWPESIAGVTVDSQMLSGLDAFQQAVALIASSAIDVAIAGGVDSASRVPAGASTGVAVGQPFGKKLHDRYIENGGLVPPGIIAERLAHRRKFKKKQLDAYAVASIRRAELANKTGAFKGELLPVASKNARGIDTASFVSDDEINHAEDLETLSSLFEIDGVITAQTFARPADNAAALLVMSAQAATDKGLAPLARVVAIETVGTDVIEGDSGAGVVSSVLARAGVDLSDVGHIELLEDSAATPLAFVKDMGIDAAILNPTGGALATGLAPGAAGTALVVRLVHGMERTGSRYGIAVIAGAGGLAGAVLLERP